MGIRMRLVASFCALVALSAVSLLALVGTAGSAKNPNTLTVAVVDLAPKEVSYGQNIAKSVTVMNVGTNPWNAVVVSDPSPTTTVPDGDDADSAPDVLRSTLKHVVCPGTLSSGAVNTTADVTCALGTLAPNAPKTLVFVWQTPAAGTASACPAGVSACIKNVVTVKGNEGSSGPDASPSKHDDTFTGEVVTTLIDTPGVDKQKAGTYALEACTTLSPTPTLSTNQAVGAGNPLATSACAPQVLGLDNNPGLQAYIAEQNEQNAPGQTQISHICLPAAGFSCFDANGGFDPDGYTPFQFSEHATFTFVLTNKSYKGILDEVWYDPEEDGTFQLLTFDTSANAYIVSITVDNVAKTTTVVVKSKQNGGWGFG